MSQEIIYTSAPKGLKPGSRGFCTVVSTGGMAKNLADRLETLSGYRHQFMPHESGENPVNYSHLRLSVGGKKYHVLSRVCDAGMDYTKRANKLAHHIAFTSEETAKAPGGPAWALSQHDFLVETWDGEVKTVPESRRRLTSEPCPVGRCNTWESQGVDSGWAGTLAESAEKKAQPMSVIFRGGADTRTMVREALALVAPDKRWDVTFTTYFTKLPAGVDCLWRFVLDGTPEATALRRNPHARLIDLCDPSLGAAPESDKAQFARTGKPVQPAASEPVAAASTSGGRRVATATPAAIAPIPQSSPADAPFAPPANGGGVGLELMPQLGTTARSGNDGSSTLKTVGLIAVLFLFVAIGMVGAYMAGTQSVQLADLDPPPVPEQAEVAPAEPMTDPEPAEAEYNPLDSLSEETKRSSEKAAEENARAEREKKEKMQREAEAAEEASKGSVETESSKKPMEQAAEPRRKPFDHILELNKMLRLPQKPATGVSSVATASGYTELAKLYVDDLADCDLKLRGEEVEEQAGREVVIERDPKLGTPTDGVVTWKIIPKFSTSLVRAKESGTFQLKDDTLWFQWSRDPKLDLELCLLDITVGKQMQTCSLVNPREERAIQVDFNAEEQEIDLRLSDNSTLRLDLWFEGEGLGEVDFRDADGLRRGGKAEIRIPDPNGIGESKHVQIKIEFLAAGSNNDLRLEAYGFPKFITSPTNVKQLVAKYTEERPPGPIQVEQRRTRINNAELAKWKRSCNVAWQAVEEAKKSQRSLLETLEKKGRNEHEARMTVLKNTLNAGTLPESRKQEKIDRAEKAFAKRLHDRKQEAERLEEYGELVKENEEWCNNMETLLKKIHDNGRIHFRAYVKTEGRELPLVQSK